MEENQNLNQQPEPTNDQPVQGSSEQAPVPENPSPKHKSRGKVIGIIVAIVVIGVVGFFTTQRDSAPDMKDMQKESMQDEAADVQTAPTPAPAPEQPEDLVGTTDEVVDIIVDDILLEAGEDGLDTESTELTGETDSEADSMGSSLGEEEL